MDALFFAVVASLLILIAIAMLNILAPVIHVFLELCAELPKRIVDTFERASIRLNNWAHYGELFEKTAYLPITETERLETDWLRVDDDMVQKLNNFGKQLLESDAWITTEEFMVRFNEAHELYYGSTAISQKPKYYEGGTATTDRLRALGYVPGERYDDIIADFIWKSQSLDAQAAPRADEVAPVDMPHIEHELDGGYVLTDDGDLEYRGTK